MAKASPQFQCSECGAVFPRWQGRCSVCEAWNTLEEISSDSAALQVVDKAYSKPIPLAEVSDVHSAYIPTGISDFDHLLGGGLVQGSVILLGGEPGIGKSTLALQVAMQLANSGKKVLYVSAEEAIHQYFHS